MPSQNPAANVLNSLIETTLDSANGYRDAAENVDRSDCKTLFAERAAQRQGLVRRLQDEVRAFGEEPETDQSFAGKAHNKFVELKNAVTGGSDKAVVDEVERGEDVIKAKYEQALRDDDLPPSARALVQEAYNAIKADHDEVSRLKHQMH
ncbi:PA2169 family four-helix-bundle protein [Phenylobacterium sp. J426]|uniref:PA2169 family four-helix-bundle protein n=1 Tax=Phenylobacterium sp. J426 TaxID=2898439 RepID=UPI002150EE95|nr:PA2169 family four-helix-bundle protein [Phenylobacterium sp. J426]MCR5876229.1 PA2169 family four-helix-bundle protein [Phenylobacterium sp. J426]